LFLDPFRPPVMRSRQQLSGKRAHFTRLKPIGDLSAATERTTPSERSRSSLDAVEGKVVLCLLLESLKAMHCVLFPISRTDPQRVNCSRLSNEAIDERNSRQRRSANSTDFIQCYSPAVHSTSSGAAGNGAASQCMLWGGSSSTMVDWQIG
jgi:hypothetical protein